MTTPTPRLSYDAGTPPVIGHGLSYDNRQVGEILAGPVKDILQDTVGNNELRELLGSVASTEFEQKRLLRSLLVDDMAPGNWRVGEAIAEAFVADKGCTFPWPNSRDLKNPDASPAGCDLTGFQAVRDQYLPYRFAFGEVKTSGQDRSPSRVMLNLGSQLHKLRDSRKTKDALFHYLRHHARQRDGEAIFKSAAKRYLKSNTTDIAVYGILIRDTAPNALDISDQAEALADNCPKKTDVEMYALCLRLNAISTLSDRAKAALMEVS